MCSCRLSMCIRLCTDQVYMQLHMHACCGHVPVSTSRMCMARNLCLAGVRLRRRRSFLWFRTKSTPFPRGNLNFSDLLAWCCNHALQVSHYLDPWLALFLRLSPWTAKRGRYMRPGTMEQAREYVAQWDESSGGWNVLKPNISVCECQIFFLTMLLMSHYRDGLVAFWADQKSLM